MKGRLTRLVLALLMAVIPAVVVAAPRASAYDGFEGTYVLWQEGTGGRCMVPSSLTPGAVVVSWGGCEGATYPDMLWTSSQFSDGTYSLTNDANPNLCLAVPNGSLNAKAIVAVCNGTDRKQRWHEDNNEYRPDWGDRMLRNSYSGYCLTRQGTTQWSDPVVQWNCAPWFRDLWWYFHTYH